MTKLLINEALTLITNFSLPSHLITGAKCDKVLTKSASFVTCELVGGSDVAKGLGIEMCWSSKFIKSCKGS